MAEGTTKGNEGTVVRRGGVRCSGDVTEGSFEVGFTSVVCRRGGMVHASGDGGDG